MTDEERLLRASGFCRRRQNGVRSQRVRGRVLLRTHSPSSETTAVACLAHSLHVWELVANQVVWIQNQRSTTKPAIAARLEVWVEDNDQIEETTGNADDADASNLPVVGIPSLLATQLGMQLVSGEQHHDLTLTPVSSTEPEIASKVLLYCLGQRSEADAIALPSPGSLVRPGTLLPAGRHNAHHYLQVVAVNDDHCTDATRLFTSTTQTHYEVRRPLPLNYCPQLPPAIDVPPHPNLEDMLTVVCSMSNVTTCYDHERILHVIGTDTEHDARGAGVALAHATGRAYLRVRGLAAFVMQHQRQSKAGDNDDDNERHNTLSYHGGWLDRLRGLQLALDQAHEMAPCVLHVAALDAEWAHLEQDAITDVQSSLWTVLMDGLVLRHNADNLGCYIGAQTPSVLVVLETSQPLSAGPLLRHLPLAAIVLVRPDLDYAWYHWQTQMDATAAHKSARRGTMDRASFATKIFSQLQGRPAKEMNRLMRQSLQQTDSVCNCETVSQQMKDLCTQLDRDRRRRNNNGTSIPNTSWLDVGGLPQVRAAIHDSLELPLQHPTWFAPGTACLNMLLWGPPGTGKTLVAKAVASEYQVPFVSVKGPELLGSYVGESEQQVRATFAQARKLARQNGPHAPICVLFFDELDSLAPARGHAASGGSSVLDRVVATLLSELDRCNVVSEKTTSSSNNSTITGRVMVLGATNRPDLLDPSLLRPGRLDRRIYLGPPTTVDEIALILCAQWRKVPLDVPPETPASSVLRDDIANDGDDDDDEALRHQWATIVAHHIMEQYNSTSNTADVAAPLTPADLSTIGKQALAAATDRLCAAADHEFHQRNTVQLDQNPTTVVITLDQILDSWSQDRLVAKVTLDDLQAAAKTVRSSLTMAEWQRYENMHNTIK